MGHFMPADVCLNTKFVMVRLSWIGCEKQRMHYPWESDITPGRTVLLSLHDIGTSFCTRMEISLWYTYSNRSELAPIWLATVWDFVVVSCKRIQSHKREPEWTLTGMKVTPVLCKHPLWLVAGATVLPTTSLRNFSPRVSRPYNPCRRTAVWNFLPNRYSRYLLIAVSVPTFERTFASLKSST